MDRRCGSCTMCCRATAVPELNKPVNVWCEFCVIGQGCKIYSARPTSCQKYECLWYSEKGLSDSLRPDRCKVIFERLGTYQIYLVMVAPNYDNVWRKDRKVTGLITKLLREGFSIAVTANGGKSRHIIPAPGKQGPDVVGDINKFAEEVGVLRKVEHGGAVIHD